VRRNSGYLRLFTLTGHGAGQCPEGIHSRFEAPRQPPLQIDSAGARRDITNSFSQNGMR
jgi:hypothetical protein